MGVEGNNLVCRMRFSIHGGCGGELCSLCIVGAQSVAYVQLFLVSVVVHDKDDNF